MSKILLYDIETTPNLAYVWGKYEQNVIAYEEEWHILCFAYKWLDEKRTHVVSLPDFPLYAKEPDNDREVVKRLQELFTEADVVIAHNGNSFDQKKSQARMMVHGLAPPTPYRQIDTKVVARRYANFNSNKLGDLGEILGLGSKGETGGFQTWLGCMSGVKASWNKMKKYNRQDVVLLEQIYLKLRPWIQNHPSVSLMDNKPKSCPNCGGDSLRKNGYYYTKVSKIQVWHCNDCQAHPRSRITEKTNVELVS